jgi:hypothetical protein
VRIYTQHKKFPTSLASYNMWRWACM